MMSHGPTSVTDINLNNHTHINLNTSYCHTSLSPSQPPTLDNNTVVSFYCQEANVTPHLQNSMDINNNHNHNKPDEFGPESAGIYCDQNLQNVSFKRN